MTTHDHDHDHADHAGERGHADSRDHTHGVVDPSLFSTERGVQALRWSLVALMITALLQMAVVYFTGSVALLADTIHNFGDALTALPLWIAFRVGTWKPNRRFTYGYGRVEDLAGAFIVFMILFSALLAGSESLQRLAAPQPVEHVWAVALAAVLGFVGNEAVAWYRIKVGREIGSAALVADGHHARVDGLTSLAVLIGAVGVWLGFPLADPLVGLGITVAILKIAWDSGKQVFARMLDGVEPEVVDEIRRAVGHVPGVQRVSDVAVRWLGHRMRAELCLTVDPALTVAQGHAIAAEAHHELLHHLPYLSSAVIHVDPSDADDDHHRIAEHTHGDSPAHSH